jgi:MFS family permease
MRDRRRWVLAACLTGIFCTTFPATILTISVKSIAEDLHSVPTTITWVTTAPMLAAAVATPVLGRLGDLRGHRRVFLAGMVVATVFAALTALAWNAATLIAFRTVSQIGAAATVPSTFAILFRSFPPGERVRASSLASATLAGAAVVGVVIGGPLVDLFGWRPIFIIQTVVAGIALVAAAAVLPRDEGERIRTPIDLPGAALLAAATFALTFGVNRLGVWGLGPVPLIALGACPALVAGLVLVERRASSPLLPLHVLSAHNTKVVSLTTFVLGAGWMGNFVITPLLLQSVLGYSAGATSLISVPRAICIMLAAPSVGRLGMRFGERRVVVWACIGLSAVMALMAVGASIESVVVIAICLPLSGWAVGHSTPGLVSAMGHTVRDADMGLATSLQQTANQIGAVVGIGLFTALAANAVTSGPFVVVYLSTAGCALVAAFLSLGLRDRRSIAKVRAAPADDGEYAISPGTP